MKNNLGKNKMAYQRKRSNQKKRSYPKRKMNISRPRMRKSSLPSLNVTRTSYLTVWNPNTSSTVGFWQYMSANLQNITNYNEYTAVFDTYRINSLKFTFRPRYDSFAGNDTTDTTLPGTTAQGGTNAHVIIDPKSSVTPTGTYTSANLNAFLENGKVRSYTGNKPFSVTVKYPTITDDVNSVTGAIFKRAPFLSTKNTNILHRGMHVFLQDTALTGVFNQSFDIFVTMNVTFRGYA